MRTSLLSAAFSFALLALSLAISVAASATAGEVRFTFIFDGEHVVLPDLIIDKDADHIGRTLPNESLLVDKASSGIANAVVMADPKGMPKEKKQAEKEVRWKVERGQLVPHINVVNVGDTLRFHWDDPIAYYLKVETKLNERFGETLSPGNQMTKHIEKPEALPCPVDCLIHPWIRGYLVIGDPASVAISGKDGTCSLTLPNGKQRVKLFHEQIGPIKDAKTEGKALSSQGNWLTVEVTDQPLELEVHLPREMFGLSDKPDANGQAAPAPPRAVIRQKAARTESTK